MAELLIYTGTYDAHFLDEAEQKSDAAQQGTEPWGACKQQHYEYKKKAALASMDYRISGILHRRLSDGTKDPSDLSRRDRRNLQKFLDGSLMREKNAALLRSHPRFLQRVVTSCRGRPAGQH